MTITLFIISMFILFSLIALKIFAIKVRKIHFLADIFHKGDKKIDLFIDRAVARYGRYRKIINIFIFDFLPAYFYELLVRIKDRVAKKYYETGDGFRGRRVLKSTGSVSFFLERLSDKNQ